LEAVNCERCRLLERQLFSEIDSNRVRESEWANRFLEQFPGHTRPGQRTPLTQNVLDAPTLYVNDDPTPNPENPHGLSSIELQELEDVYAQMVTSAKDRGIPISDEYLAALRGDIFVLHPEKYLR